MSSGRGRAQGLSTHGSGLSPGPLESHCQPVQTALAWRAPGQGSLRGPLAKQSDGPRGTPAPKGRVSLEQPSLQCHACTPSLRHGGSVFKGAVPGALSARLVQFFPQCRASDGCCPLGWHKQSLFPALRGCKDAAGPGQLTPPELTMTLGNGIPSASSPHPRTDSSLAHNPARMQMWAGCPAWKQLGGVSG